MFDTPNTIMFRYKFFYILKKYMVYIWFKQFGNLTAIFTIIVGINIKIKLYFFFVKRILQSYRFQKMYLRISTVFFRLLNTDETSVLLEATTMPIINRVDRPIPIALSLRT